MEFATIVAGAAFIALFVYSNFRLDATWFAPMASGAAASTGWSRRRRRFLRGVAEATLMVIGVALIAGGFTKMAINAGYGGF